MSFNTGINRVFLLGTVSEKPAWQIIDGHRMLCFTLTTIEEVKKGAGVYEHTELHYIKMAPELSKSKIHIEKDDTVYLQGKIQTRIVFENGIKLFKAEILAGSIEHLTSTNKQMNVLQAR